MSRYSLMLFWVYLVLSLSYQYNWWSLATSISRKCIEQFSQYIDKGKNFYISNLPSRFRDGPYILKTYAFPYYYQKNDINIRSNAETLSLENDRISVIKIEKDNFHLIKNTEREIDVNFKY